MSTCWPVCSGLRLVCSRRVEVGWASSTADAQGGDEDGATPGAEDAEVHLRVPEVRAQLSTLPSIREVDVDIAEEDIAAFPVVCVSPTLEEGIASLVQCHGLGGLEPNTVMLGWPEMPDRWPRLCGVIRTVAGLGRSVLVVR